ncbi:uncharacterized protein BDW47DRAFT_105370 [Aspergillus candidus]|uniref:Uncharacterized protein n=1 Tax=Aspergillus candidus TaxID=41067 RepID=A0A2I2FCR7_ASPCN|nr:hypothetical protein BDW47DRAFT_105370 [Aspergillus candidus]PLB38425.1 hypothetical protein BDW47DRAFT_105370 [Aspergillus candidus]
MTTIFNNTGFVPMASHPATASSSYQQTRPSSSFSGPRVQRDTHPEEPIPTEDASTADSNPGPDAHPHVFTPYAIEEPEDEEKEDAAMQRPSLHRLPALMELPWANVDYDQGELVHSMEDLRCDSDYSDCWLHGKLHRGKKRKPTRPSRQMSGETAPDTRGGVSGFSPKKRRRSLRSGEDVDIEPLSSQMSESNESVSSGSGNSDYPSSDVSSVNAPDDSAAPDQMDID